MYYQHNEIVLLLKNPSKTWLNEVIYVNHSLTMCVGISLGFVNVRVQKFYDAVLLMVVVCMSPVKNLVFF